MLFYNLVKNDLNILEQEIVKLIPSEPKEVYNMLLPYIKKGGKRIRPTISFLCYRLIGGENEKIIIPAAIIELFHNFTLIHDDIEDNSEMRRGEPTLHRTQGVAVALNSGDALYTSIWQIILDLDIKEKYKLKLGQLYAHAFRKVVDGQGVELSWHEKNNFDISEQDYINMINGKTAALIDLSCEIGAILGGGENEQIASLKEFGKYLGLSFQIKDDILNVTGKFETYKKEIGGDISEGKRTLMIVYALKNASENDKNFIKKILYSHSKNPEDIHKVISILKNTSAIDYATKKGEEFKSKALKNLEKFRECEEKKALIELAEYVLNREE